MEGEKIRILLIEDNPGDARLLRELLAAKDGASFDLEHEDRLSTALARLAQGDIDVILLDLSLPDSHGLDGLNKICAQAPKVPIVVLSGLSDEAVAINAVQEGAQDYLVKGSVDSGLLVRSLHYAIERQRLRVALRESESRYRLLADNAADVIWTADLRGRINYVSPSVKNFLGYTVDETVKLEMKDILTSDSAEQAKRLIRDQIVLWNPWVKHTPLSLTLEHIRKDGSTLWSEARLSFLCNEKGIITGILGVTREVTERIKAEEALHDSQARYRLLAENAVDVIWTLDMKGRLTYVNPSITRLLGYTVDEMMATKLSKFFTPASAEIARKLVKWEMAAGVEGSQDSSRTVVLEHVHKDGSTIWTEVVMSFLRDKQGRLTGIQGVTRDITERKKAEEALRESEQRYRLLAENVKDIIWTRDMNLKLTYTSPSVYEISGYSVDEVMSMSLEESMTPASLELVRPILAKVLASERKGQGDLPEVVVLEVELLCKDGSVTPVEMKVNLLHDSEGRPTGFLGVTRDITERKKAEEALRESEARFRTVFEGTSLSIALVDFNAKTLGINPAFERMLGYNLKEFRGIEGGLKYLHPDDAMIDAKLYIELLKGKRDYYTVDKRYIRKNGEVIWGRQNLSVVRDAEGKPKYFVAMVEDITARKKMEEALRQSEERYRELFENANDIIYIHDLAGNFISINKAAELVTGYTRDEVIGMNIARILTPESLERARQMIARKVSDGVQTQYELEIVTKDGHEVLLEVNTRLTYEGDKPVGVQGIARDITERKKADDALRKSEEKLRRYLESSPDAIYINDMNGTFLYGNSVAERVIGYSKEELIGRSFPELNLLPPEYLPRAAELLGLNMAGKPTGPDEFELVRKDGSRIFVEISTYPTTHDDKVEVIGIARDVTERKKIEVELRESEQSYKDLFESTLDGLIVLDAETMKLVLANKTAAIIGGVDSPDDLIGLNAFDMLPSDESDRARRLIEEEVLEKDLHNIHEYRMVDTNGKEKWVSVVSTRTEFQGRLATLVSIRDITERKMMEEEKRRLEEQLLLAGRLAAVGELAAGVAHELNNPIAAIKGFAQFLTARKDLDETIRKDLDTIYRESQRAAKITQNLLSFARRHEPEKHPISINDVIENILEMQDHLMKVNNIELEVELDPDLPKTMADFHQMQQVFMNIVNNAEQAMLETHGKSRLLIKTQRSGKMVQITFADNGPGISEENLKRIFDPFFTTKEVGKGTGLGLSICYGLVEAHGGRIYARSKLGQGATVVVEMPIVSQNQLVAEAALLNPSSRGVK